MKSTAWIAALSCLLLITINVSMSFAATEIDLARGRPYTLSPAPNYALCTDPGDRTDLTDGVVYTSTSSQLWEQKGCVGWTVSGRPVIITIDLGEIKPISGVSYHTAAGRAGVYWPSVIDMQFSDDGRTYYDVGDLVALDQSPPPAAYGTDSYTYHTFTTDKLASHGRYVRLVIVTEGSFVFTDEIQVFGGDKVLLDKPPEGPRISADAPADALRLRLTQQGVRQSLRSHIAMVRGAVESDAPAAVRAGLLAELSGLEKQVEAESYPESLDGFRAVVPMGKLDARILSVHGKLLAAEGNRPLTLWHTPPYEMLTLLQRPAAAASDFQLNMRMMRNEHRSQAFNLTNASAQPTDVRFDITGLPDGAVKVYQVEYVHADPGGRYREQVKARAIAAALVPLIKKNDQYATTIAAGMTRQIWLTFDTRGVSSGEYRGSIHLRSDGFSEELPIDLFVADLEMPDQMTLNTSMWDYLFDGLYGITAGNRTAAMTDMNSHLINGLWCASSTVPLPRAGDFDAAGNLIGKVNYSRWDEFVKSGPSAKHYFAFAAFNSKTLFAGLEPGTAPADRAISQWAADWAKHNRQSGLKPGQVIILFIDEPRNAADFQVSNDLIRAFKKGTDQIKTIIDPIIGTVAEFDQARPALEAADIVMPDWGQYSKAAPQVRQQYAALQKQGASLWFYSCAGPTRFFDPAYFRLQPWAAFGIGATGSNFWAYGDAGGANSWNEYLNLGAASYTPVYLSPDGVSGSKFWEALREGIEDYQYLTMLAQRVGPAEARSLAESVVNQPAVGRMTADNYLHQSGGDISHFSESARLKILDELSRLPAQPK